MYDFIHMVLHFFSFVDIFRYLLKKKISLYTSINKRVTLCPKSMTRGPECHNRFTRSHGGVQSTIITLTLNYN